MHFDGVRAAAQQYLDLGFRVVPLYGLLGEGCACRSPDCLPRDWGKHEPPETDGAWKEGLDFGVADFGETDNIALAMGPWDGSDDWLVALDFDGTSPGALAYAAELALPQTLTQETPRGFHAVYSVPAYFPLGNWVDALQTRAQGYQLDLRYARGRIVVAPSRNASGAYRWRHVQEPAPLPERISDLVLGLRHERGLPVLSVWERGGKAP